MTVMPGSLDYLYYNGVLDHIPYEAYEMTPMTQSAMAQNYGIGSTPQLGSIKQSVLGSENMGQAIGNGIAGVGFGQSSGINGSQHLGSATNGGIYGSYGNSYDSFSRSSNNSSQSTVDRMSPETYGYSADRGISYPYSQYGVIYGNSAPNAGLSNGTNTGTQSSSYGYGGSNIGYSNPSAAVNGYAGVGKNFDDISGDYNGSDFKSSITASAKEAKKGEVFSSPSLWKGLLAAAIIIATPILIIKGRKKPSSAVTTTAAATTSFWSKLNPKNWFK